MVTFIYDETLRSITETSQQLLLNNYVNNALHSIFYSQIIMQNNFHGEVMIFQIVDIFSFCLFLAYKKLLHIFGQSLDIRIAMENNLL